MRAQIDATQLGVAVQAGAFEEHTVDRQEALREGSWVVWKVGCFLVAGGLMVADALARRKYGSHQEHGKRNHGDLARG